MLTRLSLITLAATLWLASPALAEKRLALVIGNDTYANLPASQQLRKAANDARAMEKALADLGFETLLGIDLGRSDINLKLQELANKVERGDIVAVFFAGHGVRIDGLNYLLPADVPSIKSGQEAFLKSESIRVDTITDTLNDRGAKITLMFLDACRDNPFKGTKGRSVGGTRGLARMVPTRGTFIMFSAGAGQQALDRLSDDDRNPNSVFTRTLLPVMRTPGIELGEMAKRVKRGVYKLALDAGGHEQTPAVYNEMLNDFYLAGGGKGQSQQIATKPAPAAPPQASGPDPEIVFWQSVTANPTRESFEAYLQSFPSGKFAALARTRIAALQAPPEPQPQTARHVDRGEGFIFPDSHLRRLTLRELAGLSAKELRIARNEIYARKGRYFKSKDLQTHFGQFSWYRPNSWNPGLSALERWNVGVIQRVENRKR